MKDHSTRAHSQRIPSTKRWRSMGRLRWSLLMRSITRSWGSSRWWSLGLGKEWSNKESSSVWRNQQREIRCSTSSWGTKQPRSLSMMLSSLPSPSLKPSWTRKRTSSSLWQKWRKPSPNLRLKTSLSRWSSNLTRLSGQTIFLRLSRASSRPSDCYISYHNYKHDASEQDSSIRLQGAQDLQRSLR